MLSCLTVYDGILIVPKSPEDYFLSSIILRGQEIDNYHMVLPNTNFHEIPLTFRANDTAYYYGKIVYKKTSVGTAGPGTLENLAEKTVYLYDKDGKVYNKGGLPYAELHYSPL